MRVIRISRLFPMPRARDRRLWPRARLLRDPTAGAVASPELSARRRPGGEFAQAPLSAGGVGWGGGSRVTPGGRWSSGGDGVGGGAEEAAPQPRALRFPGELGDESTFRALNLARVSMAEQARGEPRRTYPQSGRHSAGSAASGPAEDRPAGAQERCGLLARARRL